MTANEYLIGWCALTGCIALMAFVSAVVSVVVFWSYKMAHMFITRYDETAKKVKDRIKKTATYQKLQEPVVPIRKKELGK